MISKHCNRVSQFYTKVFSVLRVIYSECLILRNNMHVTKVKLQ